MPRPGRYALDDAEDLVRLAATEFRHGEKLTQHSSQLAESAPGEFVVDLERMNQLPKEKVGPLARYVATVQAYRGDYNGRVLPVRQEDLRSLAVIYNKSPSDLTEELISWGVLNSDADWATGFDLDRHQARKVN